MGQLLGYERARQSISTKCATKSTNRGFWDKLQLGALGVTLPIHLTPHPRRRRGYGGQAGPPYEPEGRARCPHRAGITSQHPKRRGRDTAPYLPSAQGFKARNLLSGDFLPVEGVEGRGSA